MGFSYPSGHAGFFFWLGVVGPDPTGLVVPSLAPIPAGTATGGGPCQGVLRPAVPPAQMRGTDQLVSYAAPAAPAVLVWTSLVLELTMTLAFAGVAVKIVRGRWAARAESDASR